MVLGIIINNLISFRKGIENEYADGLYDYIRTTVPTNGYETERRCGLNDR